MADADALREPGVTGLPATPDPQPPPPPAAAPGDESVMSLVDHLGELRDAAVPVDPGGRRRLGRRVLRRRSTITQVPRRAAPGVDRVQVLGLGDAFVIQMKIALVVGIILAMPVLLYQLWAFISPGLTPPSARPSGRGSRWRCSSSPSASSSPTSSCRTRSTFLFSFTTTTSQP